MLPALQNASGHVASDFGPLFREFCETVIMVLNAFKSYIEMFLCAERYEISKKS